MRGKRGREMDGGEAMEVAKKGRRWDVIGMRRERAENFRVANPMGPKFEECKHKRGEREMRRNMTEATLERGDTRVTPDPTMVWPECHQIRMWPDPNGLRWTLPPDLQWEERVVMPVGSSPEIWKLQAQRGRDLKIGQHEWYHTGKGPDPNETRWALPSTVSVKSGWYASRGKPITWERQDIDRNGSRRDD
jgi:hypothetical protein